MQPFDYNAFDDGPLVLGLQQLRFLSKYHLKQLGFADPDPVHFATAAVKYLHLTSAFPQWQNVSVCQFDADKLDIVDDDCGRHPVPLWVAKPKAIVLEELLDEVAGILEGLAQAVPCKLPKRQVEGLEHFTRHVLQRCQNQYEETFRRHVLSWYKSNLLCAMVFVDFFHYESRSAMAQHSGLQLWDFV